MVFDSDRGRRWNVMTLEGEDRLRVRTTTDPNRLDQNVTFSLLYRRVR